MAQATHYKLQATRYKLQVLVLFFSVRDQIVMREKIKMINELLSTEQLLLLLLSLNDNCKFYILN